MFAVRVIQPAVRVFDEGVGNARGVRIIRIGRLRALYVVVERRSLVCPADAVENERAEVGVFEHVARVFIGIILGKIHLVRAFRCESAHAVNLLIAFRCRIRFAVTRILVDLHRIIYIGIGLVVAVEQVALIASHEGGVYARCGVVGMYFGIRRIHIKQINGAVFILHIAENGGVVAHADVITAHRGRAVQSGALEVDIRIFHVAFGVARRRRRCVIHPVAVDIKAGCEILRNDQLRNDRLYFGIVARVKIALGDAHERAFYGRTVSVVRRVALYTVYEVDVIARFHADSYSVKSATV